MYTRCVGVLLHTENDGRGVGDACALRQREVVKFIMQEVHAQVLEPLLHARPGTASTDRLKSDSANQTDMDRCSHLR